jgi:uncharacterized protein
MGQALTGALDLLESALDQLTDSGNAPVLLMLGSFKFSLNTAVFQKIDRTSDYRWASIPQVGWVDAQQFTGYGDDVITLPGVIYPDFRGDGTQMGQMRALAQQGKPQRLIGANGAVAGYWVITQVSDSREFFKPDGSFRKQEFTLSLKYYAPELS